MTITLFLIRKNGRFGQTFRIQTVQERETQRAPACITASALAGDYGPDFLDSKGRLAAAATTFGRHPEPDSARTVLSGFRQSEHTLRYDVALNLRRAGLDRIRA